MAAIDRFLKLTSSQVIGPLAISLAILILVVTELGLNRLVVVIDERAASVQMQLEVGRLRRTILFMENSMRGYLLTGNAYHLRPYREQERVFRTTLDAVMDLTRSDPIRRSQLAALVALSMSKYAELTETLRLYSAGQSATTLGLLLDDEGQQSMTRISQQVDTILSEEALFLVEANEQREAVLMYSRLAVWLLVLLCVAGAYFLMRLGRDQERERRIHLTHLLAERDRLDEEVAQKTAQTLELALHMERVREDERGRLARELHDELGGLLTSAKLDVARMRKRIVDDTGTLQGLLAHLVQVLDLGIAVKRQIIEDLRPSALSSLGLQRTLEMQCADFAQRAEVAMICAIDDVKLSPECDLAVYRLVQEALTNIAKYAHAKQVRVTLRRLGDLAEVVVEDDGVGFDMLLSGAGGGHGLQGMCFRVRACAGDVEVHSSPGQGTRVKATVPT